MNNLMWERTKKDENLIELNRRNDENLPNLIESIYVIF